MKLHVRYAMRHLFLGWQGIVSRSNESAAGNRNQKLLTVN